MEELRLHAQLGQGRDSAIEVTGLGQVALLPCVREVAEETTYDDAPRAAQLGRTGEERRPLVGRRAVSAQARVDLEVNAQPQAPAPRAG